MPLVAALWLAILVGTASSPWALIGKNWFFIPIGVAGAILGNISAVGGGIVFIPCIVLLFHFPPLAALKIALATQAFGMTSGAWGWLQRRVVPLGALKFAVPGLLIGSIVSTFVVHPNGLLVKLLSGPVSIALAA